MKKLAVDVAVIGAGTAGLSARREAKKVGASVVMIEGGPYGTTCARVGCMPSKLLIQAADVAHEIRHAERFGVLPNGKPTIDGAAVLHRVQSERDRFVGFVLESVDEIPSEEKVRGYARFVEMNRLAVDDHTEIEAKAFVLATGTTCWIPPALEGLGDRVITNDQIFELKDLPKSMAVLGMGVIGLELGQAMHRLGVKTTCLTPSQRVGPLTDPVIKKEAIKLFGEELDLHVGITELSSQLDGDAVLLSWKDADGSAKEARVETVLASAGRRPNLAQLDLDKVGLVLNSKAGLDSDPRTGQVGDSHIFVAGDVSGFRPLLHEAADGGRIAGGNAARFPEVDARERRAALSVVFSDPNIASVGLSYRELDLDAVTIGEVSYGNQGRARVMGKNRGHVRIYARTECGTLLGAEMLGPRVEHTAHLLAWAVQQKLTLSGALEMPFYHPVIEEGIRTALRDGAAKRV